jgi:hypothetical protein
VHGGDHAGTDISTGGSCDQLVDGFPTCPREGPKQLATVEEEGAQQLRDGQGPHAVRDVVQHLVAQEGAEDRTAFRRTRWAESAAGAGEGEQVLVAARVAGDAGKASTQVPAVGEGEDHIVDEASPASVEGLEALLPGCP